jgi:hydroxymethylpyrimidine/phosphomethylpyrimidine kinase
MTTTPVVMTIAGSDSSAGAGIQADLKTMSAYGTFGTTAITAITAQNSHGITMVEALSPAMVLAQVDAVMADFPVAAIKIGMVGNDAIATALGTWLAANARDLPVVLDPVMRSSSNEALVRGDAIATLLRLLPYATVLTPNSIEASRLSCLPVTTVAEQTAAAEWLLPHLRDDGRHGVLIKGGHIAGDPIDVLVGSGVTHGRLCLRGRRIDSRHTHGTGCTFASAIAAALAHGDSLVDAVRNGHTYVRRAIMDAPGLGGGHGPLQHFPSSSLWRPNKAMAEGAPATAHEDDERFLARALVLAGQAAMQGEVPVGAVIVHEGVVIAEAHNTREHAHDATGHAEITALRHAGQHLRRWRLHDCTLYVTLEPCFMCAGALMQGRISRVVFGARDPRAGAMVSLAQLGSDPRMHHIDITEGVHGSACGALLQSFFASKRGR